MIVVGYFPTHREAYRGAKRLRRSGFAKSRIRISTAARIPTNRVCLILSHVRKEIRSGIFIGGAVGAALAVGALAVMEGSGLLESTRPRVFLGIPVGVIAGVLLGALVGWLRTRGMIHIPRECLRPPAEGEVTLEVEVDTSEVQSSKAAIAAMTNSGARIVVKRTSTEGACDLGRGAPLHSRRPT
jgi:hypothetical protein